MDTQRLILFFIFSFSLLLLWDAWEKQARPKPVPAPAAQAVPAVPTVSPVPTPAKPAAAPAAGVAQPAAVPAAAAAVKGETLRVQTDLLIAEIDTLGATLSKVELLKHKQADDQTKNLVLLGPERQYFAQSGLAGEAGPNHRTLWKAQPGARELAAGASRLEVRLSAEGAGGVHVEKIFVFSRDSYVVEVTLEVHNKGTAPLTPFAYFQLTHNGKLEATGNSVAQSFGAQSFAGFAEYTDAQKFQKVHFSDLDKGKAEYVRRAEDGWIAFVQHYFVAAWLPSVKARARIRHGAPPGRRLRRTYRDGRSGNCPGRCGPRRGSAICRAAGAAPSQSGSPGL